MPLGEVAQSLTDGLPDSAGMPEVAALERWRRGQAQRRRGSKSMVFLKKTM
jgi:hypothetical protein